MANFDPKYHISIDDSNVYDKVLNYINKYGIITDATFGSLNNYGDPYSKSNKIIDPIINYLNNNGIDTKSSGNFFNDTEYGAIYWLYDGNIYSFDEANQAAHDIADSYIKFHNF